MLSRSCFFTSISSNYLAKAIAWARSVRSFYPEASIYIFCINYQVLPEADRLSIQDLLFLQVGGNIFLADPLPYFTHASRPTFCFNITEICTAVKPSVCSMLLQQHTNVTYMDPDTILYSIFEDDIQKPCEFELVPHILSPDSLGARISPRLFLQSGAFNLGYFYATRSTHALAFLDWWATFLSAYCFDFVTHGLYVDQKPCDLAPCFIDNLKIVRHPGYNVAWWNLLVDRSLVYCHGRYAVNYNNRMDPLVFFHFSNFPNMSIKNPPISRMTSKIFPGQDSQFYLANYPTVEVLYNNYAAAIKEISDSLAAYPAFAQYQKFSNTKPIWGVTRSLYREAFRMNTHWDPFESGNIRIILRSLLKIIGSLRARFFYRSLRYSAKSLLGLFLPTINSYSSFRPIANSVDIIS